MEEYENNSLHNCTDESELDSQPSPAEDFAAPQVDPNPEAEVPFTPDATEEPQKEEQDEQTAAYHNAGTGRRESPFADSPYVMGEPPREESRPTGDWETAYNHFEAPKQPKVKKPREKKSRGAGPIVAAALACAVIGGIGGGALTAHLVDSRWEKTTAELQSSFQSQLEALASGKPGSTGNSVTVNPVSNSGKMTPAQVYAQNVQSVVAITNQGVTNGMFGQEAFTGSGSGFILTADGYVLTNHHVIDKAQAIRVTLSDGSEYEAQLVGSDAVSDVALLKIEAQDLPAVTIGSSDNLEVGDQVAAIGNPLGELTSTQTVGYVSAKDRSVNTDGTIINMLQTDAAINSGNSGGPLFNMNGEVIGITTAKYSGNTSSGASIEGIGFAIPINEVRATADELIATGKITRPGLGITGQVVSGYYDYVPSGIMVATITEGSPAQEAGMRVQDIITAVDGQQISSFSELRAALYAHKVGDTITVTVFRESKSIDLSVTLVALEQNQ